MDNQESKFDEWGVKRRIAKARKKQAKLSIEVKKGRLEDWGLNMPESNPTWKRSVSWRILAGVFGLMFGLFVFIIKLIFSIGAGAGQQAHSSTSNSSYDSTDGELNVTSSADFSPWDRTPYNSLPTENLINVNPAFQEQQASLDNDIDFFRNH
ncbi:MAG: hypothetical protein JKY90_01820 [Gammaproteobacteria bacterium]|nr:hypothetical protein [Gammaproteobacteria bacterium]